jgi:hypothetical protein
MTQALDVHDGLFRLDSAQATSAPESTAQGGFSKFGTFAITFGIAFALLYTVYERLNWPLFTYHPVSGQVDFWKQMTGVGPPMFWYGWMVLAAISAFAVAGIATMVSGQWLRRASLFCCVLAVLWPVALSAIQYFIVYGATFDADFLNSVWVAAIPALIATAAITYWVSDHFAERLWPSLLLLVPIGGLVVLGYSLQQYFVR